MTFYIWRTVPFDLSILQHRFQTEQRPYLPNPSRADSTLQLWIDAIEEAIPISRIGSGKDGGHSQSGGGGTLIVRASVNIIFVGT